MRQARYDHFGWELGASEADIGAGRLAETHEYFHRQLDDTTAFGGLLSTIAALADVGGEERWVDAKQRLLAMVDLVHESFAVGMSLLTTQRPVAPIDGYPTYDRHVRVVQRLVGESTHPWVSLAALRAAATACMQPCTLASVVATGLGEVDLRSIPRMDRPNHRLAALLAGNYLVDVGLAAEEVTRQFGREPWWAPATGITLPPESMDGEAADASGELHRRLLERASSVITEAGGSFVDPGEHHDHLRELLVQAQGFAPDGLARLGALVEAPGGELLHGGPLDGQTIELAAAPRKGYFLPRDERLAGVSGEGETRHLFVAVTTPNRIRSAYELEGTSLPEGGAVACVRSTVFEDEMRHSVLHLAVESPDDLSASAPAFVSVMSSAVAEDAEITATWMRWADPGRVSLVMDTPATAALRRWCAGGARFGAEVQAVQVSSGDEVRIIAGRVRDGEGRSPLVIIPTTEFGARWFESACIEDDGLGSIIVEDTGLFERESAHLDIVLGHLLLEERFIGTGSWRR